MATTPHHPSTLHPGGPTRRASRCTRFVIAVTICCTLVAGVLVTTTRPANADAGFGVGLPDIATDGFTHPWLGGYVTNAGVAYCIQTARGYPRAEGNEPAGDLPAARGVPERSREALAYALWAYADTDDPTTAAGLAVVVHGLSGDQRASLDVPTIAVSDPHVYAAAVRIFEISRDRLFWVSDPAVNPWHVTTTLTHTRDLDWEAVTTVTTSNGQPIVGGSVDLTPRNVTDRSAQPRTMVTDTAGQIHTTWTQVDRFAPISLRAVIDAPGSYRVWKGPDYPGGTIPQQIVTPTGTRYQAEASAELPTGAVQVRKATANPAYQSAEGVTFSVTAVGETVPLGTLRVGSDGTSNELALPVGSYVITEVSAPPGIVVDPTEHPVTVAAGETASVTLRDPVRKSAALSLVKVDADTREPVAGASLVVRRDDDHDGTFETTVATVTSAAHPVTIDGLAAGDYEVTETAPPPGYLPPDSPSQRVSLVWNQTKELTFADVRRPHGRRPRRPRRPSPRRQRCRRPPRRHRRPRPFHLPRPPRSRRRARRHLRPRRFTVRAARPRGRAFPGPAPRWVISPLPRACSAWGERLCWPKVNADVVGRSEPGIRWSPMRAASTPGAQP